MGAADHVQQGFRNTIANWPLTLIGIALQMVFAVAAVLGLLLIFLPLVIFGVISRPRLDSTLPPLEMAADFVRSHPFIFIYGIFALTIVLGVLMIIYSFGHAARLAPLLDGAAKAAALQGQGPYRRFAAFSAERWGAAGKRHWWSVFLILNVVWAAFGILLAVCLAVIVAAAFADVTRDQGFGLTCGSTVITGFLLLLAAIFTSVWSHLATIERVRTGDSVGACTLRGWRTIFAKRGEALWVQLLLFAASIATTALVVSIHFGSAALESIPGMFMLLIPVQIVVSLAHSALAAFLGVWFSAAFVSVVTHERMEVPHAERVPQR